MELKYMIQEETHEQPRTRIRVIGVGGGGSNAVARMMGEGLSGVEFCVMNTDAQALEASPVPSQLQLGTKMTRGLGAGSDPMVGRQAALEDTEKIIEMLEGADMVFVAVGLGGGTGTGAAPVVASLAKELGALTVAVVTKPFTWEGSKRKKQAEQGLAELAGVVDTIITIPNDQLLQLVPKSTSFVEAFRIADDVLRQGVQGISDIITTPGLINRDFSDIRAIMQGMGYAMMGTALASGENAAVKAAEQAIASPLLEAGGVSGARGILINLTASSQLSLFEVSEACSLIRDAAQNEDVQIDFGVVHNEGMKDAVKITVIATGFQRASLPSIERKAFVAPTAARAAAAAAAPAFAPVFAPVSAPVFTQVPEPIFTPAPPVYVPAAVEIPQYEAVAEPPMPVVEAPVAPPAPRTAPAPAAKVAAKPAPVAEIEEPIMPAAHTNGHANGHANGFHETLFDDLDMPAILRRDRDRRVVQ